MNHCNTCQLFQYTTVSTIRVSHCNKKNSYNSTRYHCWTLQMSWWSLWDFLRRYDALIIEGYSHEFLWRSRVQKRHPVNLTVFIQNMNQLRIISRCLFRKSLKRKSKNHNRKCHQVSLAWLWPWSSNTKQQLINLINSCEALVLFSKTIFNNKRKKEIIEIFRQCSQRRF